MRPQGIDHLGPLPHQKIRRVRCSINWLCCSADLTCTKRMVGRRTASQISLSVGSIVLVALDVGLHIPRYGIRLRTL